MYVAVRVLGSAVGCFLGLITASFVCGVVFFAFFWESEPCGATTCDNDGALLWPLVVAAALGGIVGGLVMWRATRDLANRGQGPGDANHSETQHSDTEDTASMTVRTGALAALACGLVLWPLTLIVSPWLIPVAALALGYWTRTRPALVGALIVAFPLLLAGPTTPRGDGDGLWTLVFPILAFFGLVSMLTAALGSWAGTRRRGQDRDSERSTP